MKADAVDWSSREIIRPEWPDVVHWYAGRDYESLIPLHEASATADGTGTDAQKKKPAEGVPAGFLFFGARDWI